MHLPICLGHFLRKSSGQIALVWHLVLVYDMVEFGVNNFIYALCDGETVMIIDITELCLEHHLKPLAIGVFNR